MIIGFGNNVVSSLAADITAGQTTIQVMPGTGAKFAGLLSSDYVNTSNSQQTYAKITLTDAKETVFEICHLISVNNDVLTVVRGQEGTTAKGWALNDVIANFATRGSENQFVQIEQLQSGQYLSGVAGGTANALTLELPATYFTNGGTNWVLRAPIVVYPTQNNTGPSTLQLTMGGRVLGTFPMYKGNNVELVANDVLKDVAIFCLMDINKTFFTVLNPGGIYSSFVPVTRKVNGHELISDVNVTSQDIFNGQSTSIGNAVDLNTLVVPGLYYQGSNAQAQAGSNYPEAVAGALEVYKHAGITQVYRIYADSRSYIRIFYNGTWTPWAKQYDSANKPTPSDIGAVSVAGGDYSKSFRFGTVSTVPTERNSAGLFSDQPPSGGIVSGLNLEWYTHNGIIGLQRDNGSGVKGILVLIDGNTLGTFALNGDFGAESKLIAGSGVYESGGNVRVYSPNNPPPQQDLTLYATSNWVTTYFVMNVRLGGESAASSGQHLDGYVLTAFDSISSGVTGMYKRPLQILINSQWLTVGSS